MSLKRGSIAHVFKIYFEHRLQYMNLMVLYITVVADNILIGDDANYYAACTSAIPITKTHRGRGGTLLKADIDKHRKVKIQQVM